MWGFLYNLIFLLNLERSIRGKMFHFLFLISLEGLDDILWSQGRYLRLGIMADHGGNEDWHTCEFSLLFYFVFCHLGILFV